MSRSATKRDPATGELKLATRLSPPRKDTVFRRLEASLSKEEWEVVLGGQTDERFQFLWRQFCTPGNKASLPVLAKQAGLTYPQVLKAITQHRIDQGLLRMSSHVPQVLEDVAVDSQSRTVTCPTCRNKVRIEGLSVTAVMETFVEPETKAKGLRQKLDDEGRPEWELCLTCDGAGTLRKTGDPDARKLMFETLKLTGQKGPLVAQQFNMPGGTTPDQAVEDVSQVLDVPAEPKEPT